MAGAEAGELARAPEFRAGLAAWTGSAWFEAHEHWEVLWRQARPPAVRALLQALIQLAAALHKLGRPGGLPGASSLLAKADARLAAVPPGEILPAAHAALRHAALALRAALGEGVRQDAAVDSLRRTLVRALAGPAP